MPVQGDVYIQRSKEEILSFLESELQQEWGEDIDLTESSVFSTFAEALSTLDAELIEPAIEDVFEAAYLDSAEGEALNKLVAILGISRRPASHATGTVEFRAEQSVNQTNQIINGQAVQTDSSDPVEFQTTELVNLFLRDDFESGTLSSDYSGDTSSFSVVDGSDASDPDPARGDHFLRKDTTADVLIYDTAQTTSIGHTMDFYVHVPSGSEPVITFGDDGTDRYRIHLDQPDSQHRIEKDFDGTETVESTSSFTIPTGEWLRVEVKWLPDDEGTIRSNVYQDDDDDDVYDDLVDTVELTGEDDIEFGGHGFAEIQGVTCYFDHAADRSVIADARCSVAGPDGNVGVSTLTVLPTVPSGVQSVSNRYAMGDTDRYLTSLSNYAEGLTAETDAELRNRARVSEGETGFATAPAIISKLRGIGGGNVKSVTLYQNKTATDNTGSGGLPPHAFEAVIFGTAGDQQIADALFEVKGFTAHDYGGAHGTGMSETVEASNGQEFTLEWSEPTEIEIDMTLDLVVDDTYVGNEAIRERIVNYIGGTTPDGTEIIGDTDQGEDVYIDQIEDAIVGPSDTGVIGVDDSGTSYTPSTTTDANGLDIISIGEAEAATTNGEDGSITITTTTV